MIGGIGKKNDMKFKNQMLTIDEKNQNQGKEGSLNKCERYSILRD